MTSSIGMEKFTMRDTEVGVMDDREFEKKKVMCVVSCGVMKIK